MSTRPSSLIRRSSALTRIISTLVQALTERAPFRLRHARAAPTGSVNTRVAATVDSAPSRDAIANLVLCLSSRRGDRLCGVSPSPFEDTGTHGGRDGQGLQRGTAGLPPFLREIRPERETERSEDAGQSVCRVFRGHVAQRVRVRVAPPRRVQSRGLRAHAALIGLRHRRAQARSIIRPYPPAPLNAAGRDRQEGTVGDLRLHACRSGY